MKVEYEWVVNEIETEYFHFKFRTKKNNALQLQLFPIDVMRQMHIPCQQCCQKIIIYAGHL